MFREALDYPTRAPAGGKAVLVGGVLLVVVSLFSAVGSVGLPFVPLVVVGLIAYLAVRGYYVRTIRTTIGRTEPVPPRFSPYGPLVVDGLKAVVISGVYLLPAVAVLGPAVVVTANGIELGELLIAIGLPPAVTEATVSVVGIVVVFGLMYAIGALYVLPVAVAKFAHTGSLRAAFEVRTVVSGALTEDYVVAWLVSMLLYAILVPISYLLYVLLVGFFLRFFVGVGVRYCYGQGVGSALDLEAHEEVVGAAGPARPVASELREGALDPAVRRISGDDTLTSGDRTGNADDTDGDNREDDDSDDPELEKAIRRVETVTSDRAEGLEDTDPGEIDADEFVWGDPSDAEGTRTDGDRDG